MFEQIPLLKRAAVEQALQQTFGTTVIDDLTVLTGGLSSAVVCKVVIDGTPYVLRLVMEFDALRNPARVDACMQAAAQAGIAPRVFYTDVEAGVSISEYVEAKPLSQGSAPDDLIPQLARTIRTIHGLPLFPKLVNFLDGVDTFIEIFHAHGWFTPEATTELFEYYAEIQRRYPRHDPDIVSSHNDLNPNNVLTDGQRLWIIDWEAAFQNDRYVDLAIAANYYAPDEAQREALFAAYFGDEADEVKRARFFLMRQICRVYYGLIMINLAASERPADTPTETTLATLTPAAFWAEVGTGRQSLSAYGGKLIFGKILLTQALADMKTPRFAEALARMG